nr:sirohydrochlorin chelatase [Neobacillus sp. Marseille-Q6967]
MKAILYIGHGTRSKKGSDEAKRFIERVMARIDINIQEISFLELTEPLIEEGFIRCMEKGATEIIVVPLFLLSAGHIKQDIPQALSVLQNRFPDIVVTVKDPFGIQDKILDAVAELVRYTTGDILSNDRLLIVGRGSSDPSLYTDFELISSGIRERLGIEHVSVSYLAAAEPRFKEGLALITEGATGKIVVVPYLLFQGLLLAEINQEVRKLKAVGYDILHTGPLSSHRVIEDVVIERALGE